MLILATFNYGESGQQTHTLEISIGVINGCLVTMIGNRKKNEFNIVIENKAVLFAKPEL